MLSQTHWEMYLVSASRAETDQCRKISLTSRWQHSPPNTWMTLKALHTICLIAWTKRSAARAPDFPGKSLPTRQSSSTTCSDTFVFPFTLCFYLLNLPVVFLFFFCVTCPTFQRNLLVHQLLNIQERYFGHLPDNLTGSKMCWSKPRCTSLCNENSSINHFMCNS